MRLGLQVNFVIKEKSGAIHPSGELTFGAYTKQTQLLKITDRLHKYYSEGKTIENISGPWYRNQTIDYVND